MKEGILRVSRNIQRVKTYSDNAEDKKTEVVINNSVKTKAGFRSIPIMDEIIPLLKNHKKEQLKDDIKSGGLFIKNDLVFCNELGHHLEPRLMIKYFEAVIKKSNIMKANFHSMRHTFATRALENGIPAKVVQEILGHSSITMTLDLYSHVLPEMKKEEMKKLKGLFN